MSISKKITFQCHHCQAQFPKEVQVVEPKQEDSQIVYETTECPHCKRPCQLELYADEVLVTSVHRGKSSFTTLLIHLENQVFPTRPL
jgi:NAD-dependent SIR2 family protein deacetylase